MLNSDSEEQAPAILPLEGNSATVFCLIQHYGANPGWKPAINRKKIVLLSTDWEALLTTGHTGANLGEGFCIFFVLRKKPADVLPLQQKLQLLIGVQVVYEKPTLLCGCCTQSLSADPARSCEPHMALSPGTCSEGTSWQDFPTSRFLTSAE